MAVADSITKRCCKCELHLPAVLFCADKRATDGLQPRCRKCTNEGRILARQANPEKYRARESAYYANNAAKILATNAKSRAKHIDTIRLRKKKDYLAVRDDPAFKQRKKEYNDARKDEKRAYDREYRARREDELKAIHAAWREKNPEKVKTIQMSYVARRRSQIASGDPTKLIHAWRIGAKKVCHWCSVKCPDDYHVDHYEPLAKGGKHVVSNLVIACPKCNHTKNARDPYEFAASRGRLF